jgi:hypothetical protein
LDQTGDRSSGKIVVDGDGWLEGQVLTAASRQQIRRVSWVTLIGVPLNAHGAVHLPVAKNALRIPLLK